MFSECYGEAKVRISDFFPKASVNTNPSQLVLKWLLYPKRIIDQSVKLLNLYNYGKKKILYCSICNFLKFIFNWKIIALRYCVGSCHTEVMEVLKFFPFSRGIHQPHVMTEHLKCGWCVFMNWKLSKFIGTTDSTAFVSNMLGDTDLGKQKEPLLSSALYCYP